MSESMNADGVSVDELDCIGDTIRQRLKYKGIESRADFIDYTIRVKGLWWNSVEGVGELTAERIEDEFDNKFNNRN